MISQMHRSFSFLKEPQAQANVTQRKGNQLIPIRNETMKTNVFSENVRLAVRRSVGPGGIMID